MAEFKVGDRVRLKGIGAAGTVAGEASVHGIAVQWDGEFDWCSPETLEVVDKPLSAAPCSHDWLPSRAEGSLAFRCSKCGMPGRLEIVSCDSSVVDDCGGRPCAKGDTAIWPFAVGQAVRETGPMNRPGVVESVRDGWMVVRLEPPGTVRRYIRSPAEARSKLRLLMTEDDTDEHVPLKLAEEERPPHLHRWSWDHGKDRWRCCDCGAYKPGQVAEVQVFDVGGEG